MGLDLWNDIWQIKKSCQVTVDPHRERSSLGLRFHFIWEHMPLPGVLRVFTSKAIA